MGCKKLQLPDYFQLVENDQIKYRAARFSGNQILATNNTNGTNILFNDLSGTTLGVASRGSPSSAYVSAQLTSFGDPITPNEPFFIGTPNPHFEESWAK